MSKKLIVGNWKMNPSNPVAAKEIFSKIKKMTTRARGVDVGIAVPHPFISLFYPNRGSIALASQDAFWESAGAFTGAISPLALKNLGVKYVILGHSERRALGETNKDVARKIKAVLTERMTPIVCVGEKVRHGASYFQLVKKDLLESLEGLSAADVTKVVIAYEPLWAIGVKALREATAEEASEMARFIKKLVMEKFRVKKVRVIYGGSVDRGNAYRYLESADVDGLLPGRASLDPVAFSQIIKDASKTV